jgi:hypothetical protein
VFCCQTVAIAGRKNEKEENPEACLKYQAIRLGDNFGDGPMTVDDTQRDLFQDGENLF